ncbi:MAG: hypothetical protein JRE28_06615 [Deltaproteobacteria bacterium]|nr:hypothetical protein [Deltaproteobacteria bacterium]
MTMTTGDSFRFEAGCAMFGTAGMQTFSEAGAGVWADKALADDFLQCAVQSGIGTLRIGTAHAGEEVHLRKHLEEFVPDSTSIQFVHMKEKGCEALTANGFTGIAFNVSPEQERAMAGVCAHSGIPFVSAVVSGAGLLLRYSPAGQAHSVHRPACDVLLKTLATSQPPDWVETIVGMAAGFHTWHFVQSSLCSPRALSQVVLLDLWAMRRCDDATVIDQVLTGVCHPERIPWQVLWTQMR